MYRPSPEQIAHLLAELSHPIFGLAINQCGLFLIAQEIDQGPTLEKCVRYRSSMRRTLE